MRRKRFTRRSNSATVSKIITALSDCVYIAVLPIFLW